MKKYFYIVLFFVITNELYSQEYYPLHKSNLWSYGVSSPSKKVTVISDSLFSNGKHYAVLSEEDIVGGQYIRTDSLYVYYYDTMQNKEIPFFKLDGKVGDITEVRFRAYSKVHITKIDSTIMFNEKVHYISYLIESMTITKVTLSDIFGPTSASYFDDPPPPWPKFTYNLIGCKINGINYGLVVSVKQQDEIPNKFNLFPNYPNPFNPSTTIEYNIDKPSEVRLIIYDVLGRELKYIVNEFKNTGYYKVVFNGKDLPSGIYYYRLVTENNYQTKPMILLK